MSKITNEVQLNPVWLRMLYSCTRMATVGVKRVNHLRSVVYSTSLRATWTTTAQPPTG